MFTFYNSEGKRFGFNQNCYIRSLLESNSAIIYVFPSVLQHFSLQPIQLERCTTQFKDGGNVYLVYY